MAIQGTQVPMYTNTHCFCIFQFFLFLYEKQNKAKLKRKQPKTCWTKTKQSIKLDANAWGRKKRGRDQSMEMTPMFWRKNSKRLLSRGLGNKSTIIGVNKLKSENTIFDKLSNEVISNLYVFGSRILNQILKDVDGTNIVTIDGKMLLINTIIMEEFLHS